MKSILCIAQIFLLSSLVYAELGQRPLLPLQEEYRGEENGLTIGEGKHSRRLHVRYIHDEAERASQEIILKNGKFYHPDGKYLDTRGTTFIDSEGKKLNFDRVIIVMDDRGKIYHLSHPVANFTHHSTLVAGKPVKFAGEIMVNEGVLQMLLDRSGHYAPSLDHTYDFIHYLQSKGVKINAEMIQTDFRAYMAYFKDRTFALGEMDEFLEYSLRSTIIDASEEGGFTEMMVAQNWRSTNRRNNGIGNALDRAPQYLNQLFDHSLPRIPPKIEKGLSVLIETHASEFFDQPQRAVHLAQAFGAESGTKLLAIPAASITAKVGSLGLNAIHPSELTMLGFIHSHLSRQKNALRKKTGADAILLKIEQAVSQKLDLPPKAVPEFYSRLAKGESVDRIFAERFAPKHCFSSILKWFK